MELRESDLQAARAYLRMRLDAEASMADNLEAVVAIAAQRIVEICYKHAINPRTFDFDSDPRIRPEIEEVVQWLREAIEDMLYTLATHADEDNASMIWAWVRRRRDGMTFDERLDGYLGNFSREMELLVGAGLFLGLTKMVTADSIKRNLRKPWNNPELVDGIAAPLSYGRGRTNSMTTALLDLTRFGVGEAWMYARHLKAARKDAVGFYTFRNSTYPCDYCDSYADTFHLMDEPTPPLHGHCVCGTIYINTFGEPINF